MTTMFRMAMTMALNTVDMMVMMAMTMILMAMMVMAMILMEMIVMARGKVVEAMRV